MEEEKRRIDSECGNYSMMLSLIDTNTHCFTEQTQWALMDHIIFYYYLQKIHCRVAATFQYLTENNRRIRLQ